MVLEVTRDVQDKNYWRHPIQQWMEPDDGYLPKNEIANNTAYMPIGYVVRGLLLTEPAGI